MSQSIRFLGFAVLAWAGVRAASLGLLPGTRALAADPAPVGAGATLPPIAPTRLEPDGVFDPPAPAPADPAGMAGAPTATAAYAAFPAGYAAAYPVAYPVAYAAPPSASPRSAAPRRAPARWAELPPGDFAANDALDAAPLSRLASAAVPERRQSRVTAATARRSVPEFLARRLDRLQLSTWAMMRDERAAPGLASAGSLGGSQAGARLDYRFSRAFSATVRLSSAVQGPRGAEIAPGLRWRPFRNVPLSLIAERRQAVGAGGGQSGFALLVEGGVSDMAGPLGFRLDSYVQGGAVGLRDPLPFVDGAATLTRPIWGRFSGGVGLWGGAQPGLWRIDAGPRLTMPVARGMKLHLDWRQQLAGNAGPGSGAVATVAADF